MSLATLDTQARPLSCTFSRAGILAAVCADKALRIFALPDGRLRRSIRLDNGEIDALDISPDGSMIAAGTHSGHYTVWNAETGATLHEFRLPFYPFAIAFSPDNKRLAVAPVGEPVQIRDAVSGAKLLELQRPAGGTAAIAFSPDGSRIATGDADTVVRLYSVRNGELLARNSDFLLIPLTSTFTPDGRQILAAGPDKHIAFLDAANGTVLRKSAKLPDPVAYLEVSPDGSLAVAALMHADNLAMPAPVLVFDTSTARQVAEWLPTSRALGCGWTSNGRLLAATAADGAIDLWQVH